MRYCLENGDSADIQSAVRDSFAEHRRRLIPAARSSSPSYADLRRQWFGSQRNLSDPYEHRKVWDRLVQVQFTELIEPLVAQMQNLADPVERNLGLALANASDLLHRQSLLLLTDCAKAAQQHTPMSGPLMGKEEFHQWKTSLDEVRSLIQMLPVFQNGKQGPRRSVTHDMFSLSSGAPKPKSPASVTKAS
jgi:hypothetical protein